MVFRRFFRVQKFNCSICQVSLKVQKMAKVVVNRLLPLPEHVTWFLFGKFGRYLRQLPLKVEKQGLNWAFKFGRFETTWSQTDYRTWIGRIWNQIEQKATKYLFQTKRKGWSRSLRSMPPIWTWQGIGRGTFFSFTPTITSQNLSRFPEKTDHSRSTEISDWSSFSENSRA